MVTPYIVFDKQCEEAMNFYEKLFNGQNKEIIRYGDYAPDGVQEDVSDYVLHGSLNIFDTQFTFADEFSKAVTPGSMIYLTINPSSLDEGTRIYDVLKETGEILLPATETFYSPLHATVKDQYGIMWNIIVINN